MSVRVAVVVFPGTNCELDVVHAVQTLDGTAELVFHTEQSLGAADAVVVPGGFAHGDYLRTGAIARFSPVMTAVADFAAAVAPSSGSATASRCSRRPGCSRGRYARTPD